jgi:hypothetical protein
MNFNDVTNMGGRKREKHSAKKQCFEKNVSRLTAEKKIKFIY